MTAYLYPFLGVATPIVAGFVYWWRVRVDAKAKAEAVDLGERQSVLDAQAAPIHILKDFIIKREGELLEMRKYDRELREQDRAERAQYVEILSAMREAIKEMGADIRAHREEERQRSDRAHEEIGVLGGRLIAIEAHIGLRRAS